MDSGQPITAVPLSASMAIISAVLFPALIILVASNFASASRILFLVAAGSLIYAHRTLLRTAWNIPSSRKIFLVASTISTALFLAVVLGSGNAESPAQLQDYLLFVWIFVLPFLTHRIRASLLHPAAAV
jgi:hypothetical protein